MIDETKQHSVVSQVPSGQPLKTQFSGTIRGKGGGLYLDLDLDYLNLIYTSTL